MGANDHPSGETSSFPLHVERWGSGPPVLMLHGSLAGGSSTWSAQRPLSERWTLVVPSLRGYHPNPPAPREDFERHAGDVAPLVDEGVHVVGHSYGGLVAMLVAASRPSHIRSLMVIEPPAFSVARDNPVVQAQVREMDHFWRHGPAEPAQFLNRFLAWMGVAGQLTDPLPSPLGQHARLLMHQRPGWEANVPMERLRRAAYPVLVVSGGGHPVAEAICDALADQIGAERAVLAGAGHAVQRHPEFNVLLETFVRGAEERWEGDGGAEPGLTGPGSPRPRASRSR